MKVEIVKQICHTVPANIGNWSALPLNQKDAFNLLIVSYQIWENYILKGERKKRNFLFLAVLVERYSMEFKFNDHNFRKLLFY